MNPASTSALTFHSLAGCLSLWLLGPSLAIADSAPAPPCHLSWTKTKPVAHGGWGRMIRLANGAWLAVSTRFSRRQSSLQLLLSNDAARTWTNLADEISPDGADWPDGLGTRLAGHYAGPWVTSLLDGRLLLTSCSNTLSCSDDFGRTWQAVEPPPWNVGTGRNFIWPAIYQTGRDVVAAMVSWHGVQLRFGTISAAGG